MMEKRNVTAIILSALLCFLLMQTGKLKDSFEFSQTYMLLFLCIKDVLNDRGRRYVLFISRSYNARWKLSGW